MSYEWLQRYFSTRYTNNREDEVLTSSQKGIKNAICGALAGGIGSFLTTPMDVVKTRMMTSTEYKSVLDAILRISREEGLLAFFSGTTPRLMHKIPANGLFFLSYEVLKTALGVKTLVVQ